MRCRRHRWNTGDVAKMFRLRTENKMLRSECVRLAAKAGEGMPAFVVEQ